ncbi:exonuclease SbcCD subunit D [Paenibacillus sp. HB172176]|uniref:exonuclease SbcCD subunit D n=1 Tax=Paenibacillus sp. HB172176 TaxID=2493690 RepID=UPI001439261C|nr:exonuclease SbcCD subunit D [Paenibacillus sp. HB172176]
MKLFHTADWHLGKLVQGIYMTEDQRHVLEQFLQAVADERPDAIIIAGDLYDRGVPPTEAVELLDELLERMVIGLGVPVLAIAGNHDSPDRINFGARLMANRGLHLRGHLSGDLKPVVLSDGHGEVHFHLVPYADPAAVRHALGDDAIRSHDDAMRALTARLKAGMDEAARHVLIGHAFVTQGGHPEDNTSDSERPLAIGGAEYVNASYFDGFHYTALGHLHQAHYVGKETVRYAGSPLKYSISEEKHSKGYLVVELDGTGAVSVEKRELKPLRDMRRISAYIEELETHPVNEDYVYVTLLNDNPVLYPMEKVRAVYPNAMHVERKTFLGREGGAAPGDEAARDRKSRQEADPIALFAAFYQEVKGEELSREKQELFAASVQELLKEEGEAI